MNLAYGRKPMISDLDIYGIFMHLVMGETVWLLYFADDG